MVMMEDRGRRSLVVIDHPILIHNSGQTAFLFPYTQDSTGAQANERNAVTRIESAPRLPAHADSTVATLDSDVALRLRPGLLHALHDRHPDGRHATGDVPVVSIAQDPRPANVDDDDNRKWKEDDMYSDAWDRSTPAQSLPAGAVALSRARSTNPEMFRRGWKSAGPPGPELPPDMDDSEEQTATCGAQRGAVVGLPTCERDNWRAARGALDGSVSESQTADYGYAHEKATFDTPICGSRTETNDGYAPGRMHGVANGARPRRRMDDMTTDYDYDAHAATYDARPRAVDDVEGLCLRTLTRWVRVQPGRRNAQRYAA